MRFAAVARGVFALSLGSSLAHATPSPDDQGTGAGGGAGIINGQPTRVGDYPTVVGLELGGGLCTGTLIHPEWVLTAAHCVHPDVLGLPSQQRVTETTVVDVDTSRIPGGRRIAAADTIPFPGWSDIGADDFGLIRLSSPVDDRAVSPINRISGAVPPGQAVTLVGYGQTQGGQPSTASVQFELVDEPTIACASSGAQVSDQGFLCFRESVCPGDSGGPAFAELDGVAHVVGIASFADRDCAFFGGHSRTERQAAWVQSFIGPSLRCVRDGLCTDGCYGATLDLDCPMCAGDGDCAAGTVCLQQACVPAASMPGGLGAPCEADLDCVTGSCASDGTVRLCSASCRTDGEFACPDGFDCLGTGDGNGACWPAPAASGGCAAGSSPGAGALLILGLTLWRRRRRT